MTSEEFAKDLAAKLVSTLKMTNDYTKIAAIDTEKAYLQGCLFVSKVVLGYIAAFADAEGFSLDDILLQESQSKLIL